MKNFNPPVIAFLAVLAAGLCGAQTELWRQPPPTTTHPYPKKPPREPRIPARLTTMMLDGTFESYTPETAATSARDETGRGLFFGMGDFKREGVDGGTCVFVPGGNGPTIGFEGKGIPFKPNTWYRVEYMFKGIPFKMVFSYPREAPTAENGEDYLNTVIIDNNFGGGYGFCYVCSECKFVKVGGAEDGTWIEFGFKKLPDECPNCGADGSKLYREGDRQAYPDWTLLYEDFKTGDYVGTFRNIGYYWMLVSIGSASWTSFDNFMIYEITEEGGEAVGGDLLTELPAAKPCPPPRSSPLEIAFGPAAAGHARETAIGVAKARVAVAGELGVAVPRVSITRPASLDADNVVVYVRGKAVWKGKASDAPGGQDTPAWLVARFTDALRANAARLLSLDDTRVLLDRADLADAVKDLSLPAIHTALRNTLAEGKPILDLQGIVKSIQ